MLGDAFNLVVVMGLIVVLGILSDRSHERGRSKPEIKRYRRRKR